MHEPSKNDAFKHFAKAGRIVLQVQAEKAHVPGVNKDCRVVEEGSQELSEEGEALDM